jgi:hypothetical protein
MSDYAPLFSTRIRKGDQRVLQHAAARQHPKPQHAGTWARDVLREAAVTEIAVQTMRRIDAVGLESGLDVVTRTLNRLSAAHSPHATNETDRGEGPTLSDDGNSCQTKSGGGR